MMTDLPSIGFSHLMARYSNMKDRLSGRGRIGPVVSVKGDTIFVDVYRRSTSGDGYIMLGHKHLTPLEGVDEFSTECGKHCNLTT
jgi:hypothetical protein